MKIKKFFKNRIKKLPSFTKTVSFITSLCFLLSIFVQTGHAFALTAVQPVQTVNLSAEIKNTIVPFNLGRVTDASYVNKGDIIINIQDLHSHEQTQRNISAILSVLDKKYGLDKVYVEGAVGGVNTKWLENVKDKNVQEKLLNNLLKSGRLTGSEYYAVKAKKSTLLQGIEDKNIYITNLKRLNNIYNLKEEIENHIPYIQYILEQKSLPYYSVQNKKINDVIKSYHDGKIKTVKYINFLLNKAQKAGINLSKYKSVTDFAKILSIQQSLNPQKLSGQTQELLMQLKNLLPFKEYKELADLSAKKETETDFYFELLKKAEKFNLLEQKSLKNINLFFEYLILNQNLNPVDLTVKETQLIRELNDKYAKTQNEKNIYFLQRYLTDLSSYLNNKMTAAEYDFFIQNLSKFKLLWKKYIDIDDIINVTQYFDLFTDFYKDNIERNRIFVKNMLGKMPKTAQNGLRIKSNINHNEKIFKEVSSGRKIHVVITGGFHTYGFNKILEDEGINYIVITPNVTEEASSAETKYEQIFKQQTDILYETLQKMLVSQIGEKAVLNSDVISAVSSLSQPLEIEILNAMLRDASVKDVKVVSVERVDNGFQITLDKKTRETVVIPDMQLMQQQKSEKETIQSKNFDYVLDSYEKLQIIIKNIRDARRAVADISENEDLFSQIQSIEENLEEIEDSAIKEQFKAKINSIKKEYFLKLELEGSFAYAKNKLWYKIIEKTVRFLNKNAEETVIRKKTKNIAISVIEFPLMVFNSTAKFTDMHYDNSTNFAAYKLRYDTTKSIKTKTNKAAALSVLAGIILSLTNVWLLLPSVIAAAIVPFIVNVAEHTRYNEFVDSLETADILQINGALSFIEEKLKIETDKKEIEKLNAVKDTITNARINDIKLSIKQKYEVTVYGKKYITEAVSERQAFNNVVYKVAQGNRVEMYKIRESIGYGRLPVKKLSVQVTSYAQTTGRPISMPQPKTGEYEFNIIIPGINDAPDLYPFQKVYARSPRQAIYTVMLSMFYATQNGQLKGGLYETLPFTSQESARAVAVKISEKYAGKDITKIIKNLKPSVAPFTIGTQIVQKEMKQLPNQKKYDVFIPNFNDSDRLDVYRSVFAVDKRDAVRQAVLAIIKARERGEIDGGYYNYITTNRDNFEEVLNAIYADIDIDKAVTLQENEKPKEPQYEQLSIDSLIVQQQEEELNAEKAKPFTQKEAFIKLADYVKNNFVAIKRLFSDDVSKKDGDKRGNKFSRTVHFTNGDSLFFDFSRTNVDDKTIELFTELLNASDFQTKRNDMLSGKIYNLTEERAVLHTALRNVKIDKSGNLVSKAPVYVDGKDVMPDIIKVLLQMKEFSSKLISGEWKGVTGKPITDVVSIGIGGSDLGPRMATDALSTFKKGPDVHFVSNVDPNDMDSTLNTLGLNPETTLFIIESKTFTTEETITNANIAKNWIVSSLGESPEVISKHFVAVSTNKEKVEDFGIDTANMFEFWNWVGGRFSVWSAVGLPLMCSVGFDNFIQFLSGAAEMDENFKKDDYANNIAVIMAMLNVLNRNFLNRNAYAILPYNRYLRLFTAHIQQVYMESLGKSVDINGNAIDYSTGSEIYGTAGTDAQHSYLQEHHQGTDIIPVDFIGYSQPSTTITDETMKTAHKRLLANMIAQANAMAFGRTYEETVEKLINEGIDEQTAQQRAKAQTFEGNRPSTILLFNKLTPVTLGALTALYEDMVATLGIIWNINAFDQMGVELGKVNAKGLFKALQGEETQTDSSTQNLIDIILNSSSKLSLSPISKISNSLSAIITKTFYGHLYLTDYDSYAERKQNIEETITAVLEAPLLTIMSAESFVRLHYKNAKTVSDIKDLAGYNERLEGTKEIKKQSTKTFFKTLALTVPVVAITSVIVSAVTGISLLLPALITPFAIALIASISKNIKEHIAYNLVHSHNRLLNLSKRLTDLTQYLTTERNDVELEQDITKMIEAGFNEEYIIKLLTQYFSLRNGKVPETIYEKTDEIKFGTAGVRGIMGYEFDFLDVSIITQAISNVINAVAANQNQTPDDIKVLVGGDSRFMSKQFAEIASKVLAANGIRTVISTDDVPSPAISYYTRRHGFTLSINITASHNPKEYNGFKITLSDGGQATTDITSMIETEIKAIQNRIAQGAQDANDIIKTVKSSSKIDVTDFRKDFISDFINMMRNVSATNNNEALEEFKLKAAKWTVVVDPKNGATKYYYPDILKYFGFNTVMTNDTRDVTFADQKPEPSAANMPLLIKTVKERAESGTGNLLGISTDVDGDRFGVVAQNGQYVTANEIGLIIEQMRLEKVLNTFIDDFISGKMPIKEFLNKKLIIARNCATSHTIDYLAQTETNDILKKRFDEIQKAALLQNVDVKIEELINKVEVKEVNVGFKYMGQEKHKAEKDGNIFLLAIESSGGISIEEWIYDKCGFLANVMLLTSLVNSGKQPQKLLNDLYKKINYDPKGFESAVKFQEIVAREQPSWSPDQVKAEANKRQNSFKQWCKTATVEDVNVLFKNVLKQDIKAVDVAKVGEKTNLEGIKVKFSDNSWILLRLSGTEPLVRVFVETKDEILTEQIAKTGEDVVKGKFNELASAAQTLQIGTQPFKNVIKRSVETLQRAIISILFKDNTEYTIVADAGDLSRIRKAHLLSEAQIKVNLVLAGESGLIDETDSRLSTTDGKLAFALINKPNENLTVYGYEQIEGQKISEQEALIAMLEYLNDASEMSVKILDMPSSLQNISAVEVAELTKDMFTVAGIGKTLISMFSDAVKNKMNKTQDMFIKPSLVASNITKEQVDSFSATDIQRLKEQGVTTIIISVNDEILKEKTDTLKNLLQNAHDNGLKTMFDYTFNLQTLSSDKFLFWIKDFDTKFAQFKENGGIDGLKLDLSQSGQIASNGETVSALSKLAQTVNEQNVGSFLALKMPSETNVSQYEKLLTDYNVKLIVDYDSDFISQGILTLNRQVLIINVSADKNGVISVSKLTDIFEKNKVSMISFDSTILESVDASNGFSFAEISIGTLISSIFETTPEGKTINGINKGKMFVVNANTPLNQDTLNSLYEMYASDTINFNVINSLLDTNFKENISKYELEGFVQGVLQTEEMRILNFTDTTFDKLEYGNLLAQNLVKYRLLKGESFDNATQKDVYDVLDVEKFSNVIKPKIEEIFNILNSSYEDKIDTVINVLASVSDGPQATAQEKEFIIEGLILLLGEYASQNILTFNFGNTTDDIANIKALLRAA